MNKIPKLHSGEYQALIIIQNPIDNDNDESVLSKSENLDEIMDKCDQNSNLVDKSIENKDQIINFENGSGQYYDLKDLKIDEEFKDINDLLGEENQDDIECKNE